MSKPHRLSSITLFNYKGFEKHTISLKSSNVLVGANNAGKSTALGALRLIAAMLPTARRVQPNKIGSIEGRSVRGWAITSAAIETSAFSVENIRHDFHPLESRIEVAVSSGAKLVATWPAPDDDEPDESGTFFVIAPSNSSAAPRAVALHDVPYLAVVPTVTPLDHHEGLVSEETIRRNLGGRRSSRYLRNALWRLEPDAWDEFRSFVYGRTPEISNLEIRRSYGDADDAFDLFFEEGGTRHEREIAWAGDGMQIWLQVLFHIWRQPEADVLILDEPDVFLHPDLQRRLSRMLFGLERQVILATHSVEVLSEADPGSAVWVDRARRRSERPRPDGSLALLGRRLGSGYELGVGRALRSSRVLFVEGDDAPVLAQLAKVTGHSEIAAAEQYATVPLGGFTRKWRAGAFDETMTALGGSVKTFVILDGDLRAPHAVDYELSALREAGTNVHVWSRRELENYLLIPESIAAVSGAPVSVARALLDEAVDAQFSECVVAIQTQRLEERGLPKSPTGGHSLKTVLTASADEHAERWKDADSRRSIVDAKVVIRSINQRLQSGGHRTLNLMALAKRTPSAQVPDEIVHTFDELSKLFGWR